MEGILLRILWVFGRGMSYWPVYRGWPVYRWPVWEVSLYSFQFKDQKTHSYLFSIFVFILTFILSKVSR